MLTVPIINNIVYSFDHFLVTLLSIVTMQTWLIME